MEKPYSKKWASLVFVLSLVIIFTYFGNALFSLNEWVYGYWGDGLKNYFHVLVSAKNSSGLWLDQVNYPFGENIFFLDAQPLLAKMLQLFGLENYSVGFVNGLPMFSLSITSVFIFLIQRDFKIPLFFNITTSIIISFLSPQVFRMGGHFALGYSCFIPIIIYLLLKVSLKPYLSYFLISLSLIVFSFLHPYFLLIGIVLVLSFLPFHLLNKKYVLVFLNFISFSLPLFIFKLSLFLTDPIIDRPENPFGIWSYRSSFEGVFLPKFKPLVEITSKFIDLKTASYESNAYVGILGFPILLVLFISLVKYILNKNNILDGLKNNKKIYLLVSSFIIWIIALYYPLQFIIEPVLEIIPALKQFRSLGRFGWIFYYVFSLFISLQLIVLYRFFKNKFLGASIVFILVFLWTLDMNGNMNKLKNNIKHRTYLNFNDIRYSYELENRITNSDYDVILSLPLFHVGSEIDNEITGSNKCVLETFKTAYYFNLPYVSTYSSRVSKSQFYKIKHIIDTGEIESLIKPKTKILIMADPRLMLRTDSLLLAKANNHYFFNDIIYADYIVSE